MTTHQDEPTLQDELRQQEAWLKAVFALFCSRVTHDIGNPLTAIKGFAQLIQIGDGPTKVKMQAGEIVNAANRLCTVMEQVRNLLDKPGLASRHLDIHECLKKVTMLLTPQLEALGIRVELSLPAGPAMVWGDSALFEGLFFHILSVCRDGVPTADGVKRSVRIHSSNDPLGEPAVHITTDIRAFKPNDPSVYLLQGVTEKMRGGFEIDFGSASIVMKLTLPRERRGMGSAVRAPVLVLPKAAPEKTAPEVVTDKPKMLIIDDDPDIGQLLAFYMKGEFDAEVYSSSVEAAELIAKRKFDMIVTDLKMPGISGLGIIAKAREAQPTTPLVVTSGYPKTDKELVFAVKQGAGVLEKPFENPEAVRKFLRSQWQAARANGQAALRSASGSSGASGASGASGDAGA